MRMTRNIEIAVGKNKNLFSLIQMAGKKEDP